MGVTEIHTGWYADESMEDGYVHVDQSQPWPEFTSTHATWYALEANGLRPEVYDHLENRPTGTYLIPRSIIERELAREVERGLALVGPQESSHCLYPPCILPAVTVRDGMPLCQEHDGVLAGWDDLVTA